MLSEDDVDIHALKRQGMTISEIARRTNHDRKTIRAYLAGQRAPGQRKRAEPDPVDTFIAYVTARLIEDPHLWAATQLDELRPLGFAGSCQTLTRQVRDRGLRPACTACAHVTKRANAIIEHPPGEETQFDWVELPETDLASTDPVLALELHPTLNEKKADDLFRSDHLLAWHCFAHGHTHWQTTQNRRSSMGCKRCRPTERISYRALNAKRVSKTSRKPTETVNRIGRES